MSKANVVRKRCILCPGLTFRNDYVFREHILGVHTRGKVLCLECGTAFVQSLSGVVKHFYNCKNKCPYCSRSYGLGKDLQDSLFCMHYNCCTSGNLADRAREDEYSYDFPASHFYQWNLPAHCEPGTRTFSILQADIAYCLSKDSRYSYVLDGYKSTPMPNIPC